MKKYKNILIINSGGGLGDTLQFIPIINFLNTEFDIKNIYYFSNKNKFYFDNVIKDIKPKNLKVIDFLRQGFGFKIKDIINTRKITSKLKIKKFDLIIDNQTRLGNSLVFKSIPHKEYVSPCLNYSFCKPYFVLRKEKNIIKRITNYYEKKLNKKIKISYKYKNIPKKYLIESNKLLSKKNKYIGFSILAGHPKRLRNFNIKQIAKVANYFQQKYIPVFFIEKKFMNIINLIKKKVPKAYFPELISNTKLRNPILVTALADKTDFCISINNGIMHMMSLSKTKLFIFFDENSEKFKPISNNAFSYDCSHNNTKVNNLTSNQIINFIRNKR